MRQEGSYIAATPDEFGAAFVAIVEARRTGEMRGFRPILEHPRRRIARELFDTLIGEASHDVLLFRMSALAQGNINVNGDSQIVEERKIFNQAIATAYAHTTIAADLTLFRSHYERRIAEDLFGFTPTRWSVCAPPDRNVPEPIPAELGDHAAIWADGIEAPLVRLGKRLLGDIPFPVRVVTAGPDAAATLASARVIVSLSEDPGTAIALAAFGRPLCAATPAAAEYLENVPSFEIWNPHLSIDAVLRALASPAPELRPGAVEALRIPPPMVRPVFGEDAPLVTIVMAVYDRLEGLRQNLQRLQRQTYPNIEIVVVSNNGPRADAICDAFPNVRYIHRDTNSGNAGSPRNDGIAAARGRYVTALDDDDIFLDDHIASMVSASKGGTRVVYSSFLLQIVEAGAGGEQLLGYDIELPTAITAHELMVMNRLGYMTVFAERSVYDEVGGYDNPRVAAAAETELWLKMIRRFPAARVERPTTIYTIRRNWSGSLTATEHASYAVGFGLMYDLHPATGLPLTIKHRETYLESLRSSSSAPPREPRYHVPQAAR